MCGTSDKSFLPSCPPPPCPRLGIIAQEMNQALPLRDIWPLVTYLFTSRFMYVGMDLIILEGSSPRKAAIINGSEYSLICFDSAYMTTEATSFLFVCANRILPRTWFIIRMTSAVLLSNNAYYAAMHTVCFLYQIYLQLKILKFQLML